MRMRHRCTQRPDSNPCPTRSKQHEELREGGFSRWDDPQGSHGDSENLVLCTPSSQRGPGCDGPACRQVPKNTPNAFPSKKESSVLALQLCRMVRAHQFSCYPSVTAVRSHPGVNFGHPVAPGRFGITAAAEPRGKQLTLFSLGINITTHSWQELLNQHNPPPPSSVSHPVPQIKCLCRKN